MYNFIIQRDKVQISCTVLYKHLYLIDLLLLLYQMLQTHQKRIHELEEKMEDMKVQVRHEIMKNENIEKVGNLLTKDGILEWEYREGRKSVDQGQQHRMRI